MTALPSQEQPTIRSGIFIIILSMSELSSHLILFTFQMTILNSIFLLKKSSDNIAIQNRYNDRTTTPSTLKTKCS